MAPAPACIWDRETLAAENTRLPGVIETMTGNFPRHSKEYHEWRKAQCEAALAKDPQQIALYDDLAVSQHKLGDHKAAIETMLAKEKIKPGLYETYSNLGTFLIYATDLWDDSLQVAVQWLDKALAINPEAHFGREKYQKWLVEWVIAGKPTENKTPPKVFACTGYAAFIMKRHTRSVKSWNETDQKAALTGVLGMMRFAEFDNPLLLEALGDILASGEFKLSSYTLASQAYRLAASKLPDGEHKKFLETTGKDIGAYVKDPSRPDPKALEPMVVKGKELAEAIREQEKEWIAKGADVSLEYERKYLPAAKKP